MANIVLYNGSEEKTVVQDSAEWHELLKYGWRTWKKEEEPKRKAGRPKKN